MLQENLNEGFRTRFYTNQPMQLQRPKMTRIKRIPVSGFPTRSDTNRPVQPQKMVRGLKFWIHEEEGQYNLCGENKGADQLRGYSAADLRLCFRICKKAGFLMTQFKWWIYVDEAAHYKGADYTALMHLLI